MAISQSGVNNITNVVNEGMSQLNSVIDSQTAKFSEDLSRIWACQKANEERNNIQNTIQATYDELTNIIRSIGDAIQTNVGNHNSYTGTQVNFQGFVTGSTTVHAADYKSEYLNGSKNADDTGLAEGRNPIDALTPINEMATKMRNCISEIRDRIKPLTAFDTEEVNELSNAFGIFYDSLDQLVNKFTSTLNEEFGLVLDAGKQLVDKNVSNLRG